MSPLIDVVNVILSAGNLQSIQKKPSGDNTEITSIVFLLKKLLAEEQEEMDESEKIKDAVVNSMLLPSKKCKLHVYNSL